MKMNPSLLEAARSLLFVPVLEARFIAKAAQRGAGAIILDLEDSIAPQRKSAARQALAAATTQLRDSGVQHVFVRVNAGDDQDIAAAGGAGADAILLPKVRNTADVDQATSAMPGKAVPILVLVETPQAVMNAGALAAHPGVCGLVLGSEDLAMALGVEPSLDALLFAAQQVVVAARASGKVPLGVPSSLASLADDGAFGRAMALGRRMGMAGAVCIHPNQVVQVNAEFSPDQEAVAQAKRILAAFEAGTAAGKGAISLDGKMLDLPIVERARAMVEQARG